MKGLLHLPIRKNNLTCVHKKNNLIVLANSANMHTLKCHISSSLRCYNLLRCTVILGTIEKHCTLSCEKVHISFIGHTNFRAVQMRGRRVHLRIKISRVRSFSHKFEAVLVHLVNFLYSDF